MIGSDKPECTCGARPWEYEPCVCGNGIQPEDYYAMLGADIPEEGKSPGTRRRPKP